MSNLGDGDENVCPAFSEIPWDDMLEICIDHKLKDWHIPGPPVWEGEDILGAKLFYCDLEKETMFFVNLLMMYDLHYSMSLFVF